MTRWQAVTWVALLLPALAQADVKPMSEERVEEVRQLAREADLRNLHWQKDFRFQGLTLVIDTPFLLAGRTAYRRMRDLQEVTAAALGASPPGEQRVRLWVMPHEPDQGLKGLFLRRGEVETRPDSSEEPRGQASYRDWEARDTGVPFRGGRTGTFPLAAFDPSLGKLEVVVVPADGEEGVLLLRPKDLKRLR